MTDAAISRTEANDNTRWGKRDGGDVRQRGFPDIFELKRRVRDRIAPNHDLGHADRAARR